MADINKACDFMIAIANDNSHGYDQTNRNGPNYDCSSLVGTALNKAGFNVSKSSTTRTLKAQLEANGFENIGVNKTRQKGDIFLKVGHHVVMCTDANNIVHASINEKGTATGGKSGDQTGKEICIRSFYTYKGGWDYCFRLKGATTNKPATVSTSSGNANIKAGQKASVTFTGKSISCDGVYGPITKKAGIRVLQRAMNKDYNARLVEDGVWGPKSNKALGNHYIKHGERQYLVTAVEILCYLKGKNPNGVEIPGQYGNGLQNACGKSKMTASDIKSLASV